MPCLIALFALFGPRVALVATWMFSDMIGRAIDAWFVAVLGFLLLPWTTLAFVVFYDVGAGRGVAGPRVVPRRHRLPLRRRASYAGGRCARD